MIIARRTINLVFIFFLLIFSCVSTHKIPTSASVRVEARQWSKVDGVVHYSDWKPFPAITLDDLNGFKAVTQEPQSIYGSDPDRQFKATGFFYTIKEDDRWWIVDPEGKASWNVAVNGVRPGPSQRKFGSEESWIKKTHKDIEAIGFNGTACWSEVRLVKYSNEQCSTPLCYTIILSLWSGYQKQARKEKKPQSSFSVFDTAFESYVNRQLQKLNETKEDHDLLGYFSDNELSFNPAILDEYLAIGDQENPNYKAAIRWMDEMGISGATLTSHQREMFLGVVAERYFKVVKEAIRKADPNHMYLGSRLHGKPKHNEYIVRSAGKYCDIISINYYGQWEPSLKHFADWGKWADKPVIITEFYAKGDDSGLPNMSGAGWRVKTQEERGIFYDCR
ncbi:MAG: agarase [Bacteroidetes bacterium]|nr:agarase [Bacteroidota bacterium]